MTLPDVSLTTALRICSAIASAGIVYNAAELCIHRQEVLAGFFDWRIVRSRYYILIGRPILGWLFDVLFSGPQFLVMVFCYASAAVLFPLALPYSLRLAACLAGFVLVVHSMIHVRLLVGMDGADQMQTVIWASLFIYCLPLNHGARTFAAAFIALQLILSYLVSGWAKLLSPVWRSGSAVQLITRTATYCTPGLSRALKGRYASFISSWATILLETAAPLLLLFGRPGAALFVLAGSAFHFGIALSMGLTTFVFAFIATLPVVYYFAGLLWR